MAKPKAKKTSKTLRKKASGRGRKINVQFDAITKEVPSALAIEWDGKQNGWKDLLETPAENEPHEIVPTDFHGSGSGVAISSINQEESALIREIQHNVRKIGDEPDGMIWNKEFQEYITDPDLILIEKDNRSKDPETELEQVSLIESSLHDQMKKAIRDYIARIVIDALKE